MSQTQLTRNDKVQLNNSLLSAHENKNIKKVHEIISQCSDPTYALHTSVYWASRMGNKEYINEAFSSSTIDVSWMNDRYDGQSFLHQCAFHGHTDVISFLISKGVNINQVDEYGNTPLHRAAFHGWDDAVKVLIEGGANLYIKNINGDTPIDEAKSKYKPNCVHILQRAMSRQEEEMKVKPSENISSEAQGTSTLHTPKPVPHEDKITMPKKPADEAYEDLLQKPPEPTDVFDVVRNISSSWFDIGSELHVPLNVREGLKKDMSLSDEAKLEKILNEWIKFETSDVTWKSILKVLQALRRRDIVREALKYLERPVIYSKYIKKDDFTPCPDFSSSFSTV